MENTLNVEVKLAVPISRVQDLLCCGMEGGIGYWATIVGYKEPKSIVHRTDDEQIYKHLDYPVNEGGAVIIEDEEGGKTYELDLEKIQNGLRAMAGLKPGEGAGHFTNFIEQNEDAETGDVFVQCCLFGEIVYG